MKFFAPFMSPNHQDNSHWHQAHRPVLGVAFAIALGLLPASAHTAHDIGAWTPRQDPSDLKKLSLDELMNLEVTSVSRRPERLSDTASAIQIITSEDIRRSGARSIPEALRLASNLQVARIDSHQYAITARGFNAPSANKLLVMIDGRTVYTPLFSGVLWDSQDTLLEDIDRIEVISGPGATLWGSNAVNGIINIITKSAKDTQGSYAEGGAGDRIRDFAGFRHGGTTSNGMAFRVYGKFFEREGAQTATGTEIGNAWSVGQGGFRLDWDKSKSENYTVQGDLFTGTVGQPQNPMSISGGNLLARYSRTISETSDLKVQAYFDRAHRNAPGVIGEDLDTIDLDFQHRFALGTRHNIVWGLGYRQYKDSVTNSPFIAFFPARITREMFSGFVQDDYAIDDQTSLTLGAKLEHNEYTGLEFQPSVRMAKKLSSDEFAWGAISRAVRTPSRWDRELFLPGMPPHLLNGGPDFKSEVVVAYELGYRAQPNSKFAYSISAFINEYDRIRSGEPEDPPNPFPIVTGNGFRARSFGVELVADYHVNDRWRFHAGYTNLNIKLWAKPESSDPSNGVNESNDPKHTFSLRSSMELAENATFDAMYRYVSRIVNMDVPGYSELDLRLAWTARPGFEISVVGQNLLRARHAEFGAANGRQYVERGVYGGIAWRF